MSYILLFGESAKGLPQTAYVCHTLEELIDYVGEPTNPYSLGVPLAIQSILMQKSVVFFRVLEEGYSYQDYEKGLFFLKQKAFPNLTAIGVPGLGNKKLIDAFTQVCPLYQCVLLTRQADLYDYLTDDS